MFGEVKEPGIPRELAGLAADAAKADGHQMLENGSSSSCFAEETNPEIKQWKGGLNLLPWMIEVLIRIWNADELWGAQFHLTDMLRIRTADYYRWDSFLGAYESKLTVDDRIAMGESSYIEVLQRLYVVTDDAGGSYPDAVEYCLYFHTKYGMLTFRTPERSWLDAGPATAEDWASALQSIVDAWYQIDTQSSDLHEKEEN